MFPHKRRLNGRFRVHETAKRTSLLFQSVPQPLFDASFLSPFLYLTLSRYYHRLPSPLSPLVLSLPLFFLSFLFSLSLFFFFTCMDITPDSRRSRSEQWSFELIWEVIGRFFSFFFGEKHWKKVAEHTDPRNCRGFFFLFFNSSPLKVAFVACHRGFERCPKSFLGGGEGRWRFPQGFIVFSFIIFIVGNASCSASWFDKMRIIVLNWGNRLFYYCYICREKFDSCFIEKFMV